MVARRGKCPKNNFFGIFGLLSYRYNLYQVGLEFQQLFDILVRPSAPGAASELAKSPCRYDDALMGGVRGGEFSTLFSTLVRAQLAALVTTQQSQDGKIGNKHSRF